MAADALSPKDAYNAKIDAFMAANPSFKGQMHIVGVNRNESAGPYTTEEMNTLRYILVDDGRDKALQKGFAFVSGG